MKAICRSGKFRLFGFSRWQGRLVVLVVLCWWVFLSLGSWSFAKEETKLTPQEWQINGILAALNDDRQSVRSDAFNRFYGYKPEEQKLLLQNSNELKKALNPKSSEVALTNREIDLEPIRRTLFEFRITIEEYSKRSIYYPNIKNIFDPIIRYLISNKIRIIRVDDQEAIIRLLIETINKSDELEKLFDDEIMTFIGDPSLPEENRILLNRIMFRDIRINGLSVQEASEKLKDTSIELKDRCVIAKSISIFRKLEDSQARNIINLINEATNVNFYSDDCSGILLSISRLAEVIKPFAKEIVAFLDKDTIISREALKVLVRIGDAARPFMRDIIDYTFGKTNSEESILLIPKLGEVLVRPYAKNISDVVRDKSKPLYIRSAAASVLSDLNLMQPYTNDVKELISNISSAVQEKSVVNNQSSEVVSALKNIGEAGKPFVQDIAKLLKLENVNKNQSVQFFAALTLLKMGDLATPYMSDILSIFKDKNISLTDRQAIANALSKKSSLDLIVPLTALENLYDDGESPSSNFITNQDSINWRWRSLVYFLSGGSEEIKVLLRWIGKSKNIPKSFETSEEARKTLEIFDKVWEVSKDLPGVRGDLAPQIARVTKMVSWQTSDMLLLEKHYKNLSEGKYDSADSVKVAINTLEFWQWFNKARNVIFTHAIFWFALIFAYPNSPQIQAIFFWNPWVRRILGFGYVGFLLTWIPFLRDRLLAPFRASLIADAGLQNLPSAQTYFPSSEVIPRNGSDRQPLPSLKGQIILEGESGLGKTMFLRYLVKSSKRNIVYLTAKRCEKGVIEAIQAKLLLGDTVETNFLKDKNFLRNLIYSGAIDVCIDGLNEVTADTRAKITQFVEQNFKGNILLTTQPLIEWNPPGTANIFTLQPLRPDQIKQFLLSRPLPKDAHIKGTEYANACEELLSKFNLKTLPTGQSSQSAANTLNLPAEEAIAIKRVLSNPMDLTIVAQMLAVGENPDLFNLQNQQYQIMAADYEKKKLREFPLDKFAEIVYQMRLNDREVISMDKYAEELIIMEHHKMVVRQWRSGLISKSPAQEKPDQDQANRRKKPENKPEKKEPTQEPTSEVEYLFRHDKIMEFFIVQTFVGNSDQVNTRLNDHISDPRFRGVYFLLATLLPLDAAQNLREQLIQYAANTKDHAVSDTFIQLLRSRSLVKN